MTPALLWLGAAFALMLVPSAADPGPDTRPVPAWLISNGVHVDVVVPMVGHGVDWRSWFAPASFPQAPPATAFLAIGWGDRAFYLTTPRWEDLRVATAVSAVSGNNPTLVHVTWLPDMPVRGARPLALSRSQHERLAAFVSATLQLDTAGRSQPLHGQHYGPRDAFFAAHGRYGPLTTCNTWVGAALRAAGVSASRWTPLAVNLLAGPVRPAAGSAAPEA